MPPVLSTPSFALIGQPNEGKTTIMATLAEDDKAKISPIPGTTQTCQRYPVTIDGNEILVFFDTPGFENAEAALAWFRGNQTLPDPLVTFIETFRATGEFPQELEILRPLAEGAAVIYVADASRPVRPVDQQEVEILRLTSTRRIGVINSKEGRGEYLEDWKRLMARDFNHVHEFNGHRATLKDRLRLLEAARAIIPEWEEAMERSIKSLRTDWEGRIKEVSRLIVEDVKHFMELRKCEQIQNPGDEARAAAEAKRNFEEAVRNREQAFRTRVCRIFHHSNQKWVISDLLEQDLFSETVWRWLGLDHKQLIMAGAIIGATIGGIIDAHSGWTSLGLAMLIGGASGAAVAWWSAEKAVDVKVPRINLGPISWGGGKMGGRQAEASISSLSNFLWIILDRYLMYTQLCASWAHGRREEAAFQVDSDQLKAGFTANWKQDQRGKVMDYVGHIRRKRKNQEKLDDAERQLRELLVGELKNLTT